MANKTLLVAQREYLDNVRTKTFWLGILAFPAIFAVAIGIAWVMQKTKAQQPYAVLDLTDAKLGARIESNARANDQLASLRRLLRDNNANAAQLAALDAIDITDPETFPKEMDAQRGKIDPAQVTRLQNMLDSLAAKYRHVSLDGLGAATGSPSMTK